MPRALLVVSAALLGLRLYAAHRVGFGDSEALYASYALHPALTFRDHPGLLGVFAELIALASGRRGEAPTPLAVHVITALLCTLVPLLYFGVLGANRAPSQKEQASLGSPRAGATWMFLATPQIAVGLYGFTPDLLLAFLWLGSIFFALRASAATEVLPIDIDTRLSIAMLLAGLGACVKASGLLLLVGLGIWSMRRFPRTGFRWLSTAAALLPVGMVYGHDLLSGPMLRHRFGAQMHAVKADSLSHVTQVLGGQLLYVSPLVLVLMGVGARQAYRELRKARPNIEQELFLFVVLVPLLPLLALSLLSSFAEPHWIAPALLSLAVYLGRHPPALSPAFYRASFGLALIMSAAGHAWVLVPAATRLGPSDPRQQIAGELYGWPEASAATLRELETIEPIRQAQSDPPDSDVAIVGPYWTICAQLRAALPKDSLVGCLTPQGDDFDDWAPRATWKTRRHLVFVTDDRFPTDLAKVFPTHVVRSRSSVRTFRGGVPGRTFTITRLTRVAEG